MQPTLWRTVIVTLGALGLALSRLLYQSGMCDATWEQTRGRDEGTQSEPRGTRHRQRLKPCPTGCAYREVSSRGARRADLVQVHC